jgi:lysine 2,3-aminomutase
LKAGIPVNNQAVLLKGINDDGRIVAALCRELLKAKVRPVYLFHCDPIRGVTHFRTSVRKGLEIVEYLRGHLSGFAVPTYAIDAPGGGGKIPLHPNTIVSWGEGHVVLRNFEGMLVSVPDGDAPPRALPADARPRTSYDSVANLTQSSGALIPQGNKRLARRPVKTGENVVPLARGVHLPIVDE